MRVMVLVKSSPETEAGQMPTEQELAEMGKYNEALANAGIMLDGEGLHSSSKGVRIDFSSEGTTSVTDGPFAETKELLAGFWLWKVESMDEAVEWAKKAPFGDGAQLELRQVFDDEDFGEAFTPELREQEQRIREQSQTQQ
ncbi:MAG TPA: YciI family protein [Thermomicrobiales bacterium]|nr:YciI family protein [Thermomicrobiales bacterium]